MISAAPLPPQTRPAVLSLRLEGVPEAVAAGEPVTVTMVLRNEGERLPGSGEQSAHGDGL